MAARAKKSARLPNRPLLIGSIIAVILLIAYLAILPLILTSKFKGEVRPAQQSLSEKINQTGETFKLGVFSQDRLGVLPDDASSTTQTQALDADKGDLKAARDATTAALARLDQSESSLTGFKSLPLLTIQGDYRTAERVGNDEKRYTTQSRTFLTGYQQLIDYADKSTDLSKQLVAAGTILDNPPDDLGAIAATLDQLAVKNTETVAEFKKLTPPEYLKAQHDQSVVRGDQLTKDLQSLAGAVRSLDLGTLQAITARLEAQTKTEKVESAAFIAKLQAESPYRQQIDQLRQLNDSITKDLDTI